MLTIDRHCQQPFAELNLNSFDSIVGFFGGDRVPGASPTLVKRETLRLKDGTNLAVFYKQYDHASPSWKFIGRASKARREFENYFVLSSLGIRCAQPLACGERRDLLGRLHRAFIITRAIPEALSLADFLRKNCPNRASAAARALRDTLRRQLAGMTGRIHRAGFFYHDLVWRNILVTWQPGGEPQLWWIDCPRGQFRRWPAARQRHRLKDLASLDKSATKHCTRGERLAFTREYLGLARLDAGARQLIRAALRYRKQRWPEDWNES